MKAKKAAAAVLTAVMLLSFGSCSLNDNDSENNTSSESAQVQCNVSGKEAIEALIEKSGDENLDSTAFYGEELFEENCVKLYDIEYSNLEDGGIAYAGSGGLADEVSIIKVSDMSENLVLQFLEKRVERRIQDFTGYKPGEISKIENSKCFAYGGYSILIISDNADDLEKQIKLILEQD